MRFRRTALLGAILAPCLLAACDDGSISRPNDRVAPGETFWLAPGATAEVEGTGWDLTFGGVLSDDRCPVEIYCIETLLFDVRVSMKAARAGRPAETFELSWLSGPRDFAEGTLRVQMLGVEPPRHENEEIPADKYRIQLVVTRP